MPRASRHSPTIVDPGSLDAEEYLDRCGVTAYMKDCVTLLLENRPDEPLAFMGDYFRTVTQPSSPLLRAYRYIRLAPPDQPVFQDNLVAAYAALDTQPGKNGVKGAELQRLLAILCSDYPIDVSHALLATVGKRDVDTVPFEAFSAAVRACLQYEAFFNRLEDVFAVCDVDGTGHAHPPLLELVRRAVSPAPDSGLGVAVSSSAAVSASAPPRDSGSGAAIGDEAPPPRPDLGAPLERDAQLAFAELRLHRAPPPAAQGGSPAAVPADFAQALFRASLGRHAPAEREATRPSSPSSPRPSSPNSHREATAGKSRGVTF